ncbi:MAG: pilus assembly protein PilM [Deltaproteobacteria bacterium]
MAQKKDINSTERLLNVIRGSQHSSSVKVDSEEELATKHQNSEKFSINFPRILTGKHRIKVSVDISRDDINFVKMAKTNDGKLLLVDQKILKYSDRTSEGSQEFSDLLKATLTAFAGSPDDCEIWAMMSAMDVNVHYLKIPIVPKKQLENVIYWTAKKENPIDEKDMIFDYEMQGEITDQGIPKYSVMAYSASRSEVQKVRDMFSSIGFNLAGITMAPFAIQNIFRSKWIAIAESTFASLFIGNDYSRIDIFSKNNLVMTRGIKTGISSMAEALNESIAEILPDKKIDKEHIQKILSSISTDPGKTLKDENGIHWNESTVLEMIAPALERLTRQIERTLDYYATSVGFEKVEKVYISFTLNDFYRPLLHYVNEQLGIKSEFLDPYEGKNASASGANLSLAERVALVPAIGLSLSELRYTPNAIFTYVEKKKEVNRKRINRGIFAAFAAALIICLTVLILQVVEIKQLGVKQGKLEKELSLINPILSKDKILVYAENLKLRHQIRKQYLKKYEGMALISELAYLTPESVRLTHVRIVVPVSGVQEQKKDAVQKEKDEGILIEGVVLGDRSTFDALLAEYVMRLENSPLFQTVAMKKSSIVNFKKKEILQFTINAKTG